MTTIRKRLTYDTLNGEFLKVTIEIEVCPVHETIKTVRIVKARVEHY